MTESTSERVECPICGDGFDPMAAGGWCTNPDCGEWQYLGDEVPEPAEAAPADDAAAAAAADPAEEIDSDADEEWTEPPTEADSSPESGDDDAPESDDAEARAASDDDELKLEFGAAPGSGDDESGDAGEAAAEDAQRETDDESVTDDAVRETDEDAGEPAAETVSCPDCGAEVEPDASFCPDCGADLDAEEATQEACPSCGADVDADDAFCAACGADLRSDDAADSATPDRLALAARGEEVLVSPDQTVGREIRRIVTDTGGDEDDAVRIHREHVRIVRENGQFYVVDLGDNPTELNGTRLSKGDREPVEPGDELVLSDVVTLAVERP